MSRSLRNLLAMLVVTAVALLVMPCFFNPSHTAHAKAKINKSSAELLKGSTVQLYVKKANGTVVWSSNNPGVATVNENGLVTALNAGKATIIGRSSGKKYKCKVKVKTLTNVDTKGAQFGIDVSIWQGNINFKKVKKDGVEFVIMRAGHGQKVDSTFKRNYKQARKNGLKVGCYWYITAMTEAQARAQAKKCLKTIRGKYFDLPVFVDIETSSQFAKGKEFCSSIVTIFCEEVKSAGYTPGWYTSRSFIAPYLTSKVEDGSGYVKWVAEHNDTLNYDSVCHIWQCSHKGRVDGIKGYVDLNWYFPSAFAEETTTQAETSADTTSAAA